MWGEKRYHSLDYALKSQFGEKVYRIALNGGMTCPNRDGKIGYGGCIFCSGMGSGDFAGSACKTITEQLAEGKAILARKRPVHAYIAYFQAFTSTYAPIEYLRKVFTEAIEDPDVKVLAIATRPDCLDSDVLELLDELNQIKPVWVELGLQTIHPESAKYIRRGYPLEVFDTAVHELKRRNLTVIVHVILFLPGETHEMILTESSCSFSTFWKELILQLNIRNFFQILLIPVLLSISRMRTNTSVCSLNVSSICVRELSFTD